LGITPHRKQDWVKNPIVRLTRQWVPLFRGKIIENPLRDLLHNVCLKGI
jgi:hypothetical protein